VWFNVVGLPDMAVQESKERVHSAIKNGCFTFPFARLTIDWAPTSWVPGECATIHSVSGYCLSGPG
jgi:predicted ATPase with chaperone activity